MFERVLALCSRLRKLPSEEAMSQITSVQTTIFDATPLQQVFVTVTDSEGRSGVGETWWGIPDRSRPAAGARPIASTVDELLAPRVVGRDAGDIGRLWFELWDFGYRYADQGIFPMALSGLDIALWDLLGHTLGASVLQLLGGSRHDAVPAYASLPPLRDPDLVISETQRAVDVGIGGLKLHEVTIDHVQNLRRRFGDDLAIMVDVNGHFDPLEAIAFGRQLADLGVTWFEEPVRPMRDHRSMLRVHEEAGVDIAAGENEYALEDFERLLRSGAIMYLQPEVTKIGGITAAQRVSTLAELYNVALSPHNFRPGPSLYASLAYGFASSATRWFEIPWIPDDRRFASDSPLPKIEDGCVLVPEGPGLGISN